MKKYIKYIPISVFATAFMLGGSLNAMETTSQSSKGSSMKDQQNYQSTNLRTNAQPMTSSSIIGMNIDNATNEKIGEIDEIYIDSNTGEVLALVVSTGGFLGMGQEQTLISPEDLRFNSDRTLMQANLTKDQIKTAPRYQPGQTTGLDRVRPLGDSRANWDSRSERTGAVNARNERSTTGAVTGDAQKDSKRPTVSSERDDSSTTVVDLGNNDSQRQTTSTDRNTNTATNRYGQSDRNQRTNQFSDSQQQNRGLEVSELIGMSVENNEGETVGEVEEVYINLANNEVVGVLVSTGEFLDMDDDRQTLFGIRELSFNSSNDKILLNQTRDQIRSLPEFRSNDQSVFDELGDRMDRLASNTNSYFSNNSARTEAGNVGNTSSRRSDNTNVFNQRNSSDEMAITESIREAISEDDSLSTSAKNITIATVSGKIVLRGEVDSLAEKATLEGIARNKAGRQNVTSELTVRTGGSTASNR